MKTTVYVLLQSIDLGDAVRGVFTTYELAEEGINTIYLYQRARMALVHVDVGTISEWKARMGFVIEPFVIGEAV